MEGYVFKKRLDTTHNFPFVGLFQCGECGGMITAQWAHGNGDTYRYYRCTKRLGSCSQRYVREDLLVEQLKDKISKVALREDWKEKMLAKVEMWEKKHPVFAVFRPKSGRADKRNRTEI